MYKVTLIWILCKKVRLIPFTVAIMTTGFVWTENNGSWQGEGVSLDWFEKKQTEKHKRLRFKLFKMVKCLFSCWLSGLNSAILLMVGSRSWLHIEPPELPSRTASGHHVVGLQLQTWQRWCATRTAVSERSLWSCCYKGVAAVRSAQPRRFCPTPDGGGEAAVRSYFCPSDKVEETCWLFSSNKELLIAAMAAATFHSKSLFFPPTHLLSLCESPEICLSLLALWACHSLWQVPAPNRHFLSADKTRTKGRGSARRDVVE